MTLSAFLSGPWSKSHGAYEVSPFNIRPAPEFATAEVFVASLYRALGFEGRAEGSVPKSGRDFDKECEKPKSSDRIGSAVSVDVWRTIMHGVLESPKQPNQSAKRFLQMSPIVPDVALYSGTARNSANSWNPGDLVLRQVVLGSDSSIHAADLWRRLFAAMSVHETDDVWASWLQSEFELRRKLQPTGSASLPIWRFREIEVGVPDIPLIDKQRLHFPARQLVRDLSAVIDAKDWMTRRQWISLLEAITRLGAVAHVLWLCEVNNRLWRSIREILGGAPAPGEPTICSGLLNMQESYLAYGKQGVAKIRDQASSYLHGRLGLNLILWALDDQGIEIGSLSSCADIENFLGLVATHRDALLESGVIARYDELRDNHVKALRCSKGIGSNIIEFGRHVLGQRQTANESLRGYDQGYVLRKRSEHKSSPWIVSLGPVSVLALVHCCLKDVAGPRSVVRLCQHLAAYGIQVEREDIAKSDLGRQLRMLGLVLDSPDAESGMLLVAPFETVTPSRTRADA